MFCVGCGVVAIPEGTPNINQVLPQTITAGSKSVTMKITGSNFANQAVVLWNGSSLKTSVVDANTLAATVASNNLATPAVAHLQVQNTETGKESQMVTVTVASASTDSPTVSVPPALTISTGTALPSGRVGSNYSTSLAATGGTAGYAWSVAGGQLPAGISLGAASGVFSGTPTSTGIFAFSVKVTDSSSPVETVSASFVMDVTAPPTVQATLPVAPPTLVITTLALPGATATQSYGSILSATGGTAPYSWSITSGQLPAGLTLSASTGAVSGTPTASGTSSFTATVSDSGSPAQTRSVPVSIAVGVAGASPLTISTVLLPSGSNGTAYATTLQANGGTPAYTWSISSGSLPADLTLAASSGVISGTPTTTGAASFTATVTDNSNPIQTQSANVSLMVDAAAQPAGPGTTWYVRTDGGTRYSSNMSLGQCDGQADAPYPGTGTDQHCAFNDVRWLWQDGSYSANTPFPAWGWVISGGDTVIIRGSIGDGVSWRVGWNNSIGALDPSGLFYGLAGDQFGSGMPVPPSGTAGQPTRILGGNYGACTSQSARTQLHGGWGVLSVLDLKGASYVDVECLDITDFSNCGRDQDAFVCETGGVVLSDFASQGIIINNTATNITLTDMRIHGMGSDGIYGAPGTGFVGTDVQIIGNADAGWNADPGDGTTGVGTLLMQNFDISWNGCVEEYPMVDTLPYFSCRDDSRGGYGDGFGTASVASVSPGWQIHFDNGTVSYNTQDGLDTLHVAGTGSTVTETRVLAYGNEGQQLKAGAGAVATMQNDVIVGNCEALVQPIPGRPLLTLDNLGDYCRAGNTAVVIETIPGSPATFQNNTLFTKGLVGLEVEYATSNFGPTNTLLYNNNAFYGFFNTGSGFNPSPIYSSGGVGGAGGTSAFPSVLTNAGGSWTNNATFGAKSTWTCGAGETAAVCGDPGLVDETYHAYGYGNMQPASSTSAVAGAGVSASGITLDYNGVTRPTPPSIGAFEP